MEKELKELIVVKGKVIEQIKSYSPSSGTEIGLERASKMIKDCYDQNEGDVIAQFTGKEKIIKILEQPECVGIRTFYGINDIGIRTLIFIGVNSKGENIAQLKPVNKGETQKTSGVIVNGGHSCPPHCGGDTPSTDSGSGSSWW